jgi:hypothetical protein
MKWIHTINAEGAEVENYTTVCQKDIMKVQVGKWKGGDHSLFNSATENSGQVNITLLELVCHCF